MKKSILFLAIAATFIFTSCGKDDDDSITCESCSILGVAIETCDNADGTVTVTTAGESQTLSGDELDGVSASTFVAQFKASCALLGN